MRGGYRAGAGRPRGSKTVKMPAPTSTEAGSMTPLEYLSRVLNDPSADEARRDRAAIALLPYTVPKPASIGAKAAREAEAMDAERGTSWDDLLNPAPGRA